MCFVALQLMSFVIGTHIILCVKRLKASAQLTPTVFLLLQPLRKPAIFFLSCDIIFYLYHDLDITIYLYLKQTRDRSLPFPAASDSILLLLFLSNHASMLILGNKFFTPVIH